MRLRELNVGCFGGGTGLPSLLGGLKNNPVAAPERRRHDVRQRRQLRRQLRDELGVLPPGDILKCALALARNAREARRVLLARLPTLEHARLGGHTGGNLLLSMMQRYSGDFLDAIDGLRALLGCRGRVWPVSVQQASVCAEYGDGSRDARRSRGRRRADARAGSSSGSGSSRRSSIHPTVAKAISEFDAVIIGPGSFYTSLMPIFLVRGVAEALAHMKGPVILDREPADRRARHDWASPPPTRSRGSRRPSGRQVDVVITNIEVARRRRCSAATRRSTRSRSPPGTLPEHCELVGGEFWTGEIARHDRRRLAYAVWSVLSRRLLAEA